MKKLGECLLHELEHSSSVGTSGYDFGEAAFAYEVLEVLKAETLPPEEWREAVAGVEDKWLARLRPYGEQGYNKPRPEAAPKH